MATHYKVIHHTIPSLGKRGEGLKHGDVLPLSFFESAGEAASLESRGFLAETTKPTEVAPAEAKPTEVAPAEAKPAEGKKVATEKPAKPAEGKK